MIFIIFLSFSSRSIEHYVLCRSAESNRMCEVGSESTMTQLESHIIYFADFENFIDKCQSKKMEITIFGSSKQNPFVFDFSKKADLSNCSFKLKGGDNTVQFVYSRRLLKGMIIDLEFISLTTEETKIIFHSLKLMKSLLISPKGKINVFVDNLVTDSVSLPKTTISIVKCYSYRVTTVSEPTAKVVVLSGYSKSGKNEKKMKINKYNIEDLNNNSNSTLSSKETSFCLCLKGRLDHCKNNLACDSQSIPLDNYVTGKEQWFISNISRSVNRTIKLYVASTEGLTLNIGFDDFEGRNNSIYFIIADFDNTAIISLNGKLMSSSSSQLEIFNVAFMNINKVILNKDVVSHIYGLTLQNSPLYIKLASELTISRIYADSKSIYSFEGTLVVTYLIALNESNPIMMMGSILLAEGCAVYIPEASKFPNVIINDESIVFSDEDQDNDIPFYFAKFTDPNKKWQVYVNDDFQDNLMPSVTISLKTNSESNLSLLFSFNLRYFGISLVFNDLSRLPKNVIFDVTAESVYSLNTALELEFNFNNEPKYFPFKKLNGNFDLVLKTPKTLLYFLGNLNSPDCDTNDTALDNMMKCDGIEVTGLNSLTIDVLNSLTRIVFGEDSVKIFFNITSIEFRNKVAKTIQIVAELENVLAMSIEANARKVSPLNLLLSNSFGNNNEIFFDDSFTEDISKNVEVTSGIIIWHDIRNLRLLATNFKQIPLIVINEEIEGVLFDTNTDLTYDITKKTDFINTSFRSGPNISVNIIEKDVIIPQAAFLAEKVKFDGESFIFQYYQKSRCKYEIMNEMFIQHYTASNFVEMKEVFIGENGLINNADKKLKISVDTLHCHAKAIQNENFDGPIIINKKFKIIDNSIKQIIFGPDTVQIVADDETKTAVIQKGTNSTIFEVITGQTEKLTISVLEKSTKILDNIKITIQKPTLLFFDRSWHNVSNPDALMVATDHGITVESALLYMPEVKFLLKEGLMVTPLVQKPKHTANLAFFLFIGFAMSVLVICIAFCIVDCVHGPTSCGANNFNYKEEGDNENEVENENENKLSLKNRKRQNSEYDQQRDGINANNERNNNKSQRGNEDKNESCHLATLKTEKSSSILKTAEEK